MDAFGHPQRELAGKCLALDLGEARIGVAASDELAELAFARTSLTRRGRERDLQAVVRIVCEEGASEIVVGLPLHLDGREGRAARVARRFAERLRERVSCPVVMWDERMTTVEAQELLHAQGVDVRRGRSRIDAEAARILLQRYLDARRQGGA